MKKWIITCALPSGARFAFSAHKNQFALVPIQNGIVRRAMVWDSEEQAMAYLAEQLRVAPTLDKLEPFEIQEVELPQ